ncbi:HNH endonuclease [Dasania marina]|uniref:HNH endonuclease n=1 Tax=Dasania marina TaxID=471499 RepID=UPI0009FFDF51
MLNPRKSLKKPRHFAFSKQKGLCYYCAQPMWDGCPKSFSVRYGLSVRQARRFQCTGEHLMAHKDGGSSGRENIVAACLFCNVGRHRRGRDLDPHCFRGLVQRRMNAGRWHAARAVL